MHPGSRRYAPSEYPANTPRSRALRTGRLAGRTLSTHSCDGTPVTDTLSLGYSPCPNDTYVFYALVHGRLEGAPKVREVLEDIETLNGMA